MKKSKKIVVTGASGNLGGHIVKTSPHEIIPVGRENWSSLDRLTKGEVDIVIHCAYDLKRNIYDFPAETLDSNIVSTGRLLKICKEKGIRQFIFISSCAVYGESSNSSEEKACNPITMNGYIKSFNEELIKNFCVENEINYLILRVFNSYGGNDHFSVIQKLARCAKEKKPFSLINEGTAERDFIHVNDVANIISLLIEKDLNNEIINIGSGQPVKIIDLFKAFEKKFGPIETNQITNNNETAYSRANIKKLKSLISYNTVNIFDFIEKIK